MPSSSGPPALVVLATASDPSAAEALGPALFDELIHVPLLHTADDAADALRSSPALSLEEGELDEVAADAVERGPLAARALFQHVELGVYLK